MNILKLILVAWMVSFLCLTAQPGLTAQAQDDRAIYVNPPEGGIGEKVRVVGEGFNKSTAEVDKYAAVFFSSDEATTDDDIDDEVTRYELVAEGVWLNEAGEFDISFIVPDELNDGADEEKIHAGIYYIYVCHYVGTIQAPIVAPRIRAVAEFEVVIGDISIDPDKGTVGTSVEIIGTDFFPDEQISIHYNGAPVSIDSGDMETNSAGEFITYFTIPKSTAGRHTITVTQLESVLAIEFTVEPDVIINPTSGTVNTSVTVLGNGFGRRKSVTIYFDKVEVTSKQTDSVGDFVAAFSVPELEAGLYEIEIDDGENTQAAKFTVLVLPESPAPPEPAKSPPIIEINRLSGHVGSEVVISGNGFVEGGTVTIEYDDALISSAAINQEGVFLASFNLPISTHGEHVLTVSDGVNSKELAFVVESEAPVTPNILLGTSIVIQEGAEIFIDWEDVIDKSMPVTYTLQLARDAGFPTRSILFEKTGLTESEYLMESSINQKLQPRQTYYWRLRAVDSASNAGEWTETGEIIIAPISQVSDWLMYLLAVLGGLSILFIWYFMRRAERRSK